MMSKDHADRRDRFAAEFDVREHRRDGRQVVNSLCYGLTTLRTLLFTRVHDDVERNVGRDSMVMPLSALESEEKTRLEIEVFQVAVSHAIVTQRSYVSDPVWYAEWLRRLRLDNDAGADLVLRRLERYQLLTDDERRVLFSRVLEKTFPEATRAPLVLYRLFPLGVSIATALSFTDCVHAESLRNQQVSWLPSITDCHECQGHLLENGERCATCGNPLWNYECLNAPD